MYKAVLAAAVFLIFLIATGYGQQIDAPSALLIQSKHSPQNHEHRFFGRTNLALLTASATANLFDALTTQRGMALGAHEVNPLARGLVASPRGQALVSTLGFSSEITSMYLLHRLHHHWLERSIPVIATAFNTFDVFNNLRVIRHLEAARAAAVR